MEPDPLVPTEIVYLSDDSSDEYKSLADRIRRNRTVGQTQKTLIFQMLLEQGCITRHK